MIIFLALGWGSSDKIKLTDVNVITLQQGRMTNSRRTHPVPQLQCVGGTAGCSAFTPRVVQCYNRGSDGYDVQVQSFFFLVLFYTHANQHHALTVGNEMQHFGMQDT